MNFTEEENQRMDQILQEERKAKDKITRSTNPALTMGMKVKEIISLIEQDGWYLVRQKGSHRQYKHPTKKGLVTISGHKLSDELAPGTLNSIYKQAQIEK